MSMNKGRSGYPLRGNTRHDYLSKIMLNPADNCPCKRCRQAQLLRRMQSLGMARFIAGLR